MFDGANLGDVNKIHVEQWGITAFKFPVCIGIVLHPWTLFFWFFSWMQLSVISFLNQSYKYIQTLSKMIKGLWDFQGGKKTEQKKGRLETMCLTIDF